MKIVLISNLYKPYNRGGAERIVELMAEGLKQIGDDVHIITASPDFEYSCEVTDNHQIHRIFHGNIFFYPNGYKYNFIFRTLWRLIDTCNLYTASKVKAILKNIKPDIVITHNLVGFGLLVPYVLHKLGIQHIHITHDVQLFEANGALYSKKDHGFYYYFNKAYSYITRKLFATTKRVVSPSQWLLNEYQARGFFKNAQKYVLPNPIEIRLGDTEISSGKDKIHKSITFVGQIEDHKGVEVLLKAFQEIRHNNAVLNIVGDGSNYEVLKEEYSSANIKFFGRVSSEKVAAILQGSYVTIVPSTCAENSPTIIYESLRAGTPIIASKVGGIPELINSEVGYLVEPNNISQLANKIQKIIDLSDLDYEHMQIACFQEVKKYSLESYIKNLRNIIS